MVSDKLKELMKRTAANYKRPEMPNGYDPDKIDDEIDRVWREEQRKMETETENKA